MPATTTRTGKIDRITTYVKRLPSEQLDELERQLERLFLLMEAESLKKSVRKNNITMKEIVDEVKKVRHGK